MTDAAPTVLFDRIYVTAKAIGRRLGCSERTVARLAKDKKLAVFKTGPNNSPLRCRRSEIDRFIRDAEGRG